MKDVGKVVGCPSGHPVLPASLRDIVRLSQVTPPSGSSDRYWDFLKDLPRVIILISCRSCVGLLFCLHLALALSSFLLWLEAECALARTPAGGADSYSSGPPPRPRTLFRPLHLLQILLIAIAAVRRPLPLLQILLVAPPSSSSFLTFSCLTFSSSDRM